MLDAESNNLRVGLLRSAAIPIVIQSEDVFKLLANFRPAVP